MSDAALLNADGSNDPATRAETSTSARAELAGQTSRGTHEPAVVTLYEKRPALITLRACSDGTGEIAVVWKTDQPGRQGGLRTRIPNLEEAMRWHHGLIARSSKDDPDGTARGSGKGSEREPPRKGTSGERFEWPLSEADRAKARAALARRSSVSVGAVTLHPHKDPAPGGTIWGVTPDGKVTVAAKKMRKIEHALRWCDAACNKLNAGPRPRTKAPGRRAWRVVAEILRGLGRRRRHPEHGRASERAR